MTDWLTPLLSLPEQCDAALGAAALLPGAPRQENTPRALILAGAGASGLAAECVQSLLTDTAPFPVLVSRGYTVPACAGPGALVVAVSHSGTTPETVYAISDAAERGANVLVVTGGGHLRDIAEGQGFPCLLLPASDPAPPPPLTLLPTLFALWAALDHVGLLASARDSGPPPSEEPGRGRAGGGGGGTAAAGSALALLRRQRDAFAPGSRPEQNPARQLAAVLGGVVPLVGGTSGPTAVAARAWATAFRRIAHVPSYAHAFPEAAHDDAAVWTAPAALPPFPSALITLRESGGGPPLVAQRADDLRDAVAEAQADLAWHEIVADGPTPLARLSTAIYLGQWAASYLSGA